MRLIDADALKEEIESLKVYISGMRSGRKIIDELFREYKKSVINIIEEQPTANQWIPCNERLPEDIMDVLIQDKDGGHQTGYYHGEKNQWNIYNPDHNLDWDYVEASDAMVDVIAWMPLPEAYKEDEQ